MYTPDADALGISALKLTIKSLLPKQWEEKTSIPGRQWELFCESTYAIKAAFNQRNEMKNIAGFVFGGRQMFLNKFTCFIGTLSKKKNVNLK